MPSENIDSSDVARTQDRDISAFIERSPMHKPVLQANGRAELADLVVSGW